MFMFGHWNVPFGWIGYALRSSYGIFAALSRQFWPIAQDATLKPDRYPDHQAT